MNRAAWGPSAEVPSHPMLAMPDLLTHMREEFAIGLKRVISNDLTPKAAEAIERELARPGRDAVKPDDIPYVQYWTALRRLSQEILADAISECVEADLDRLREQAKSYKGPDAGSLTLNPQLRAPSYLRSVDIHCMPTGYHQELCADDVAAGAMYDRMVSSYTLGQLGKLNDSKGVAVVKGYLKRVRPDWIPERILDMGCSVGHSTLPYVDAYPESGVYGIDIAAPMVRYAHARAASLGKRVHYYQDNAESTSFEDESFDLIVSHILLHETSATALQNIFRETRRLLRPGGLAVHAEYTQYQGLDDVRKFMLDWDTHHNNEPFWGAMRSCDLPALARAAGFDETEIGADRVAMGRKLQDGRKGGGGSGDFYLTVLTKEQSLIPDDSTAALGR